jgi:vacuolar-type H+-ATPase subunit E/Vma4
MSKEALLEKILSDAQKTADSILADAENAAAARLGALTDELDAYRAGRREIAAQKAKDIYDSRLVVANLEARKTALQYKQALMNRVYNDVLQALCGMKDKGYTDFFFRLLAKNAENGDVLVINEADKKRITAAALQDFCKKKGITVALSPVHGAFKGGFILQNNLYDKNLTFETLVANLREETETDMTAQLFE